MKKTLLSLALVSALFASDTLIKPEREQDLNLRLKRSKVNEAFNKNSWIESLTLSASQTKTESLNKTDNARNYAVTLSQDIFRSGGIFYAIKQAMLQGNIDSNTIKKEKRELLFDIYTNALQIKRASLQLQKQNFSIKNKELEIESKNEQFLNGLVDISSLDNALIELGDLKNAYVDIASQRADYLQTFSNLSGSAYNNINVATLKLLPLEQFLEKNELLEAQKEKVQNQYLTQKLTLTKYMPKLTLDAKYQYDNGDSYTTDRNAYNYGVTLSIPLNINTKKDLERARLDYLVQKVNLNQQKDEQTHFFKTTEEKIALIEQKVANTKAIMKRYESLYSTTKELYSHALRTENDLLTVENTLKAKKLDLQVYEIDKNLLVLNVYKNLRQGEKKLGL